MSEWKATSRRGKSAEVGLGDLAIALSKLAPGDAATEAAVAAALGFDLFAPDAEKQTAGRTTEISPLDLNRGRLSVDTPPRRLPKTRSTVAKEGQRLSPRRAPNSDSEQVRVVLRGPAVPPSGSAPAKLPNAPPLFHPKTVRSLMFFALATIAREGEIDTEALTRFLSFQEKWSGRLPRLPRSTLRLGVHVVFDRRPAMTPFLRDQNSIFDLIQGVVGIQRTTHSYFRSTPEELNTAEPTGAPRLPAPLGTPTLFMSDLGVGVSSEGDSVPRGVWIDTLARLRKAGSPAIVFLPYPPKRWPTGLAKLAVLISWDRPTTPSLVRRRVGIGNQLQRGG